MGLVDDHNDYVTSYFRSNVIAKNSKMSSPMALGRISEEWFKRGSQHLAHFLSETISLTNLPDMTLPALPVPVGIYQS